MSNIERIDENQMPMVSVIIASYNGKKYIDRCLEALVNQSYTNIEIVICDDASTDDSVAEFEKWQERDERIVLLRNEENIYAGASRNKCIDVARGEYIVIQDIDDVSELNRIEILVKKIIEKKVDFLGSGICIIDDGNDNIIQIKNEYPQKKDFLWGIPFFHPTMIFKTECLKVVQGYRVAKETRRGQDYDMLMRMYAVGFVGTNIPDALYRYSQDLNTFKRQSWSARVDEFTIRRKGFQQLKLFPIGCIFIFKPFAAHIITQFKILKFKIMKR